jgi:hypothetical protein
MVLRGAYVVARGVSGRPLCQHRLLAGSAVDTACGRNLSDLSRSYTNEVLDAILCRALGCKQVPVNG